MHWIESIATALAAVSLAASTATCTRQYIRNVPQLIKLRRREGAIRLSDRYEDEDGKATEESERRYHVTTQKVVALIGGIAGFALSMTVAIRTILGMQYSFIIGSWLFFGAWIGVLLQCLYFIFERSVTRNFSCATQLMIVSFVLEIAMIAQILMIYSEGSHVLPKDDLGLLCGQVGAPFLVLMAALLVPRRPDVYFGGHLVDRSTSTCWLSWMTWSWITGLMAKAHKEKKLQDDDLPPLMNIMRSEKLVTMFQGYRQYSKLWITLMRGHVFWIFMQWSLQSVVCLVQFAPYLITYALIRLFEERDKGHDNAFACWVLAASLVVVMVTLDVANNLMFWFSNSYLYIGIRLQLNALIFDKTMRRKDVKGTQKAENEDKKDADDNSSSSSKSDEDDEDDEKDELKGLQQGIVNHIAVDSQRVSVFFAWNVIFPETLYTIIISCTLLYNIIGWKPLLAGLAGNILTLPINNYWAKIYGRSQDRVMKMRDRRMAVVSEALHGIRQIKFSALEGQWMERIEAVRKLEMRQLFIAYMSNVALLALWTSTPLILTVLSLSTYALINGEITPSVAFSALGIFHEIEFTFSVIPELVNDVFDAIVSSKRIQDYLDSPERDDKDLTESDHVAFVNAAVAWPGERDEKEDDRFVLRGLNFEFPKNELTLISGPTGSGKSLLLSALIGEADLIEGKIEVPKVPTWNERFDYCANLDNWILPDLMAFVAQIPWIENATIKENILFGLPFFESRYKKVLNACALTKDLEILEDGDRTEIGANGINLSGGQRWRVSLARALYSRAGIVVMDDIFSAVDAHVGRHIYEKAVCGDLMKGRTQILVTHHMHLCLPKAKYTVTLESGKVDHAGFVTELQRSGSMAKILAAAEAAKQTDAAAEETVEEIVEENQEALPELAQNGNGHAQNGDANGDVSKLKKARTFVEEEHREKGAVKKEVYLGYLSATGGLLIWAVIMLAYVIYMCLDLGKTYWLKMWTSDGHVEQASFNYTMAANSQVSFNSLSVVHHHVKHRIATATKTEHSVAYWITTYFFISLAALTVGTFRYFIVYMGSLRASRITFTKMTNAILRAPIRWLDTVPVGRIINRFSSDFAKFDSNLGEHIGYFFSNLLGLLAVIVSGFLVSPTMIAMAAICMIISWFIADYYLGVARELKRMESNLRSPVLELFGSVLKGIGTVRAFGKTEEYVDKMQKRLDKQAQASYQLMLANRWMSLRLAILGVAFATFVVVFIIIYKAIDASLAGFAIAFALSYMGNCLWTIRRYADLELDMNSAERIIEYTLLPTEDESGVKPPASWPHEGRLEVKDLVMKYAPDLPPVIKGVSFDVKPRERIGVVGRTGAGKSTLTLALFRFMEADSGSIFIDGLDISKMPLHDLRSRLAIIPQDPVLFSGTVRSNLDGFNEHTDVELRDALERVHLTSSSRAEPADIPVISAASSSNASNANIFERLDSKIAEGGLNLSQGQRQLLCLARALIARPKLMVLDEATSAVDMELDALIQKSIREEFSDCTLFIIAHRINTIIDLDKVLLLGDGKVLEYDSPWNLLQKKGLFYEMVMQTGEGESLIEIAKNAAEGKSKSSP